MARSEARLAVSIWTDTDFLALSAAAQRMFMFLLSQPDLAHDGVIALRERRWSKAARGLTVAQVADDLDELAAARFIVMDEDAEELLIRSFIRRDKVHRQPNVLRAAQDHLSVVTSPVILAAIASELRRIAATEEVPEGSTSIIAEMLAAIDRATGNPSENPSENPSQEGSGNPTAGPPGERGVVTAVSSASPNPVPRSPDPVPRRRAKRAAPRADAREPRGSRIPDNFAVTPEMVTWARERVPHVDGRTETERFVNYWRAKTGKDATKLDWPATWRNWMLSAAERSRPPSTALASPADARPSTTDQRVAAGLAIAARLDAMEGQP